MYHKTTCLHYWSIIIRECKQLYFYLFLFSDSRECRAGGNFGERPTKNSWDNKNITSINVRRGLFIKHFAFQTNAVIVRPTVLKAIGRVKLSYKVCPIFSCEKKGIACKWPCHTSHIFSINLVKCTAKFYPFTNRSVSSVTLIEMLTAACKLLIIAENE